MEVRAMQYKTRLSKQEGRSWHRPAMQFPSNIEVRFSKVRTAKKKKDKAGRKLGKGGNVGEGLRKTGDLSLQDTSNFVLWEFSVCEVRRTIVVSLMFLETGGAPAYCIQLWYGKHSCQLLSEKGRKRRAYSEGILQAADNLLSVYAHQPQYDLGTPFVLEPQDESPFMKFGSVYPGQTIPALYNNLLRAPLFRHKPYSTDFLVIRFVQPFSTRTGLLILKTVRSTHKGEAKYFIREIKNLFVVGQAYPVTEVPGPHSRKITTTIKHRLQIIAFKLLKKSQGERLKITRLMKYFPDQNELQMRQRLKVGPCCEDLWLFD
jgi:transcription initiation factor TFIID subunit 1, fungi type